MRAETWIVPVAALSLLCGCPDPPVPPDEDLDGDGWPDVADTCVDVDGDGYGRPENDTSGCVLTDGDCDDSDPEVHPAAQDVCDGVDNDCDDAVDEDSDTDGDGHTTCGADGVQPTPDDDCDDGNADSYPQAEEVCDGEDNDCDGAVPEDEVDDDGDGVTECEGDCDDADAAAYPGGSEVCDGADNDCDGVTPDDETDGDADGVLVCQGDCDDADTTTYPGADELCDGVDNDCDEVVPTDEADDDGDGFMVCEGDCEDAAPETYPGATEVCDGADNDCDGTVPDDELDGDGDSQTECEGDCDDADATSYTGASEACDGVDNDCDGIVPATETDDDGDGQAECEDDCDDTEPTVYTGASEACDGLDNDCDTIVPVEEVDADADGYMVCEDDCDDSDPYVHPNATEQCNGMDDDCDQTIPPEEHDADADGFRGCLEDGAPPDCDDLDPNTYPGAPQICDGIDNGCLMGLPPEEADDDGDGYMVCELDCDDTDPLRHPGDEDGDGVSSCDGDCNDVDPLTYPGADELCDGIVNGCLGPLADEEADADADGVMECDGDCDDGDPAIGPFAAEAACDYVDNDCDGVLHAEEVDDDTDGFDECQGDCDDADAAVHPGAEEVCNGGIDDDCDPLTDEFADGDGDGVSFCDGDCDDSDPTVYLGATETECDGIDQDCDGIDQIPAYASFDLGAADGKIAGAGADDYAGKSVALVDDVNDDLVPDVVVGAHYASGDHSRSGMAYLVHGPVPSYVSLAAAAGSFSGQTENAYAGASVADAGDVDGDGLSDFLVGAEGDTTYGSNTGKAYLFTGSPSGAMTPTASFVGTGGANYAGRGLDGAGDVDGDGYDDLLVGADGNSAAGTNAGAAYLIYGPVTGDMGLGVSDVTFTGEGSGDRAGLSVAGAGDMDGDGYDDLLIGAYNASYLGIDSGKTYLIYGPPTGTLVPLAGADAAFGGENASDRAGYRVAGAGDIDGDGNDDILIGAYGNDDAGDLAGKVYLVLGPQYGLSSLGAAEASFSGSVTDDEAGMAVAGAGDVNGDGLDDILIGAHQNGANGDESGRAYLFFGPQSGAMGVDAGNALISGEAADDNSAISLAGGHDIDGDGLMDILIGAMNVQGVGNHSGAAYLITGPVVCN